MSYTVTLCDTAFSDVISPLIDLEATTSAGVVLANQTNKQIAGGYGAVMSFVPQRRRFNVEIVTSNTGFAPLVLQDLNGDRHPQTINVILVRLPSRASGPPPTSASGFAQYIGQQGWAAEEVDAVYTTINTLRYVKRPFRGTTTRTTFIHRNAEFVLNGLGIDPDLVVA
jgi:hypothetical protein